MRLILSFILLLIQTLSFAQKQDEAIIIKEKAKVFKKPNSKYSTKYILNKNEVFLINENSEIDSNWLEVEIYPNKLSKDNKLIVGFIQKSQVILLEQLPKLETNDILISFNIKKESDSKSRIRHKYKFGLEVPSELNYIVNKMNLNCNNSNIEIDNIFFEDLYNVSFIEGNYSSNNNPPFSMYKNDEVYFMKHNCGDGAGSYEITWVIKDCKIIQRLIDEI